MPEVQTSASLGEMSQRFLAMLMRQSQQIALCLGQLPIPGQEKPEIHLELAKILIDELEMIQEKTRGNLTTEESQALGGLLTELRMAFVQVSAQQAATASSASNPEQPKNVEDRQAAERAPAEDDSKRRFSKSYG